MLKVPAYRYFPDSRVTAYQDDTQFWKFYLIPDYVSIRRDVTGHPVFLLVKYAFGDQDRQENPALPRGGGYLVLDVEMTTPEADYVKIVEVLQKDVDSLWKQLKAIAEAAGQSVQGARLSSFHNLNGVQTSMTMSVNDVLLGLGPDGPDAPPGDKPPPVIISQPTWTEGTFRISAPQSEALVASRIAEGKISLIGNNVASASMDLTPAGATFMERALVNLDGTGGTNVTPIQVTYALKFLAKLPPVQIRVSADSRALFNSSKSIYHDYEHDYGCDEDAMTHSEQQMEMAVQSGMLKVQIDAGTLELQSDFLQDLRSSSLKFVQDMIKDKFFEKKPAPVPADDKTADFVTRDMDVYYMKSEFSEESMHIEYNEKIESLKEWPANPQGTLQAFLAGLSAEEVKKYVRTVDLDDPFFKTLGLTVTCFADWAHDPIAFVECQVRYTGKDENNLDVDKVQTFTFKADHPSEVWDPSLIGKKREYTFRHRVGFAGKEPGEFSPWQTETTPKLNLAIRSPGKIAIRVLAGNVDFAQVTRQIQVDLKYDGDAGLKDEKTLILANGQLEQTYELLIYKDWTRPVQYRTRFFLKNDQVLESPWQDTMSHQILINEPSAYQKLDVQLVPSGQWDNVVQTIVNLRYVDSSNGYFVDNVFQLKGLDEFRSWLVVLKDPTKRKFQYKVLTTYKDGSPPAVVEYTDADGDQSLPIFVRQSPRLTVKIVPSLVDFKVTPVVRTTLHYDDDAAGIHQTETLGFTSATEAVWTFPIKANGSRSFRRQVTYDTTDSRTIRMSEETTDETLIVLQKLAVPEITCLVVPKTLDFVQTPVVEVDVDYEDLRDASQPIRYNETLVFTDATAQPFRIQVREDSPREYSVTLTYYLADGKIVAREPVKLDKTKIVVPKYVA